MQKITFDYSNALPFIKESEIDYFSEFIKCVHDMLHNKTGQGADFTGWLEGPRSSAEELARIKAAAEKIKSDSDALVVIGIGGSYLGARAAIEGLSHYFHNQLNGPKIYFAGNHLSPAYLSDLMELLENRDVSLNVISKSGTTIEPAIAFRILKEFMLKKYGKAEAAKRIYATTDQKLGVLRRLADEENYESFVIPGDVGGRYSVLTPAGLLPIAVAGIDIDAMLKGAFDSVESYKVSNLEKNECYQYAAIRNALYRKNKIIEIMVNYEPSLHYFVEWWKQLFGESEGKEQKGIFPAGVDFTTDLHSMGQYIQDGLRNIFETVIDVKESGMPLCFSEEEGDPDGLNFLAGTDINVINKKAMQGTILAHTDGGVPNLVIGIPKIDSYWFGNAVYFFEKACAASGYLLGVNPFDQPGVEAYKTNMFALLGKPGYEDRKNELEKRLDCRE